MIGTAWREITYYVVSALQMGLLLTVGENDMMSL